MLGDEAHFARRRPRFIDHQFGHDRAELGERLAQREPGLVVADEADKNAGRAERRDVARHIAGAADLDRVALDRQHRRRRLGRNARDLAIDEVVEHHVADAQHRLLGNEPQRFLEIEHALARPCLVSENGRRDRDTGARNA